MNSALISRRAGFEALERQASMRPPGVSLCSTALRAVVGVRAPRCHTSPETCSRLRIGSTHRPDTRKAEKTCLI